MAIVTLKKLKLFLGFRIKKNPLQKLASGHGFVVQKRAILHYMLFAAMELI